MTENLCADRGCTACCEDTYLQGPYRELKETFKNKEEIVAFIPMSRYSAYLHMVGPARSLDSLTRFLFPDGDEKRCICILPDSVLEMKNKGLNIPDDVRTEVIFNGKCLQLDNEKDCSNYEDRPGGCRKFSFDGTYCRELSAIEIEQ